MILYKKDEFIYYDFETGNANDKAYGNDLKVNFFDHGFNIVKIIIDIKTGHDFEHIITRQVPASEIQDRLGVAYGSTLEEVIFGFNKGTDVNPQDQTTDVIIVKFNKVSNSTTLSVAATIDTIPTQSTITLTSVTGAADGKYIILFHPGSERFSTFNQVGAASGNVITLDGPMDFAYPAGTFVDLADTNMAVDGSSTTQTFGLRGIGTPPGVDLAFDLTRIMIKCFTETVVTLESFGDLAALTNGLLFRTRNNKYHNVLNFKSNADMAGIMFDFTPFAATNPQQGQDGFVSRLTYAGQEKIGVAIRLPIGTDAEFLVQDALDAVEAGSEITLLEVIAEGHIVEP